MNWIREKLETPGALELSSDEKKKLMARFVIFISKKFFLNRSKCSYYLDRLISFWAFERKRTYKLGLKKWFLKGLPLLGRAKIILSRYYWIAWVDQCNNIRGKRSCNTNIIQNCSRICTFSTICKSLTKRPDKSTTSYDMLDLKSYKKKHAIDILIKLQILQKYALDLQ